MLKINLLGKRRQGVKTVIKTRLAPRHFPEADKLIGEIRGIQRLLSE